MRLESIEVVGFQAENRAAYLEFSSDQISVIYGDNGCGKTTLLKIIFGVLNRDKDILTEENVRQVKLSYSGENGLHEVIVDRILDIDEEQNLLGVTYDFSKMDNTPLEEFRSLSLGVERGITKQSITIESEDIRRFFLVPINRKYRPNVDVNELSDRLTRYIKNITQQRNRNRKMFKSELSLSNAHVRLQSIKVETIVSLLIDRYNYARSVATDRIQNALFETLSLVIMSNGGNVSQDVEIPNNFEELILANKERLIEALDDGFDNDFKDQVTSTLEQIENIEDVRIIKENKLLSYLIFNMIKELEIEKRLLSSITTLLEEFNNYLADNKRLVITDNDIYIELDDNRGRHGLDYLSSGERHIFTFLALIVVEGNNRNLIFIDEPEISLNIKWQRTIMDLLRKLIPETQIIVASHSAVIAKKSPHSLVKLEPYQMNWKEDALFDVLSGGFE